MSRRDGVPEFLHREAVGDGRAALHLPQALRRRGWWRYVLDGTWSPSVLTCGSLLDAYGGAGGPYGREPRHLRAN